MGRYSVLRWDVAGGSGDWFTRFVNTYRRLFIYGLGLEIPMAIKTKRRGEIDYEETRLCIIIIIIIIVVRTARTCYGTCAGCVLPYLLPELVGFHIIIPWSSARTVQHSVAPGQHPPDYR